MYKSPVTSILFYGCETCFIIIIINPLTARVVGAPQILCNQFSPFSPVLNCPLGLTELQACPFPDVVFPPLPLSALSSSPFHMLADSEKKMIQVFEIRCLRKFVRICYLQHKTNDWLRKRIACESSIMSQPTTQWVKGLNGTSCHAKSSPW